MTYKRARTRSIRDALGRRIEDFARGYRRGQPTIVMLPGGMGSQLDHSKRRYVDDSSPPFVDYDPVWMDLGILFTNDARKLLIEPNGHDRRNHIVIPDGPLGFVVTPYDGTRRFFEQQKGWNYIVFGYDWRRPVPEWAGFLETFLKRLGRRVTQLKGENPLPNTTLLCHSMGGLVASMFLHRLVNRSSFNPPDIAKWLKQVITVATPFYGTTNNMWRYYKGQSPLNQIYTTSTIARIAGTLPGPYVLMYLDEATYNRDRLRLAQSPFPLTRYPMRDADDESVRADPYNEQLASRYPRWVEARHLRRARQLRQLITSRLPSAVIRRVFHLRSGNTDMPIEQDWQNIDGSQFDPNDDALPIVSRPSTQHGPGDGTVPAWAARLAQTPLNQVYNLRRADSHSSLMEHRETLEVVARTVTQGQLPAPVHVADETLGVALASTRRMETLVADVASGTADINDPRVADPRILRRFMEEISLC